MQMRAVRCDLCQYRREMKKSAPLKDDLLAVRRGELAFDAVTGRISSHLTSWPQSAQEVLHEVEAAFEQRIIEPDEFQQLKTIIVDTISQRQRLVDLPGGASSRFAT